MGVSVARVFLSFSSALLFFCGLEQAVGIRFPISQIHSEGQIEQIILLASLLYLSRVWLGIASDLMKLGVGSRGKERIGIHTLLSIWIVSAFIKYLLCGPGRFEKQVYLSCCLAAICKACIWKSWAALYTNARWCIYNPKTTARSWTWVNQNRVPVVWGALAVERTGGCEVLKSREHADKAFWVHCYTHAL